MVTKNEMEIQKNKDFKEVIKEKSIIALLGFALRYRMKELLILIVVLLAGYILAANIRYSAEKGFEWIPSVKTNIEIKK